jgi:SAM-dependent methyltransferase
VSDPSDASDASDDVPAAVNSQAYWDDRFARDWQTHGGPAQSRWFAELALANLPPWLLAAARRERSTIADWGCAEGDGLAAWLAHVEADRLTGVDFSPVAIAAASARYPGLHFVVEDWLAPGGATGGPTHDLVFSSNTLEHFADPERVLAAIATRARHALVLLVPYREDPRHPEHEVTLDDDRLALVLDGRLVLVTATLLDCRERPGSQWLGDQLLVVYVTPAWATQLGLTLAARGDDLRGRLTELERLTRTADEARAAADTRAAEVAALTLHEATLARRIQTLEERHARRLSTRLYRRWRALRGLDG